MHNLNKEQLEELEAELVKAVNNRKPSVNFVYDGIEGRKIKIRVETPQLHKISELLKSK